MSMISTIGSKILQYGSKYGTKALNYAEKGMSYIPGGAKAFNYGSKAVNYAYRGAKLTPQIIFSDGAEIFVRNANKAARTAVKADKSWLTVLKDSVKNGAKVLENGAKASKFGVFDKMMISLRTLPRTISRSVSQGVKAAGADAGIFAKAWGGIKGFGSGIAKKMPLIGNLMLIAFELPNVFKATKEKGITQGAAEVGKATARLTAGSIGSVIGNSICPIVGGILGWTVGEWAASKLVGKSYSEKVAEQEAKQQEALALAQQQGFIPQNDGSGAVAHQPMTPPPFVPYRNPMDMMSGSSFPNSYNDDFFMKQINFNSFA